jgi:Pyruvate/2-oxoacid:ferredoxin oxidoreductase gamma subunit
VTKLVPREAMQEAVRGSVPEGTEELNLRAFDAGWEAYEEQYGEAAADPATAAPVEVG